MRRLASIDGGGCRSLKQGLLRIWFLAAHMTLSEKLGNCFVDTTVVRVTERHAA